LGTHKVSNAANPDKKAMKKMDHNPLFAAGFGSIVETLSAVVSCFSSTAIRNY
jgi:hypothetical protein